MVIENWLVISVGFNVIMALVLVGSIRKGKREREKLITMGQALAYRDVLDSINKMVEDK